MVFLTNLIVWGSVKSYCIFKTIQSEENHQWAKNRDRPELNSLKPIENSLFRTRQIWGNYFELHENPQNGNFDREGSVLASFICKGRLCDTASDMSLYSHHNNSFQYYGHPYVQGIPKCKLSGLKECCIEAIPYFGWLFIFNIRYEKILYIDTLTPILLVRKINNH